MVTENLLQERTETWFRVYYKSVPCCCSETWQWWETGGLLAEASPRRRRSAPLSLTASSRWHFRSTLIAHLQPHQRSHSWFPPFLPLEAVISHTPKIKQKRTHHAPDLFHIQEIISYNNRPQCGRHKTELRKVCKFWCAKWTEGPGLLLSPGDREVPWASAFKGEQCFSNINVHTDWVLDKM